MPAVPRVLLIRCRSTSRSEMLQPCHCRDIVFDMDASAGAHGTTPFPGFGALAGDADEVIGRLVRRRQRLELSQTEVAARMRTSQSAVARLEACRSDTRLSTLERYATALGSSLLYGVGGDDGGRP